MRFPRNVRIALVAPEYPGNVGSTARAMFTMGLTDLWIVSPVCNPHADEAYWLAHSAAEVLRGARVVATLEEALADTVFSVGTTRRVRRVGYPVFSPDEVAAELRKRADDQPVAIVFGRESAGLDNRELALCSIQSTISCASEEHSLNLAQAVLVYCGALHQASLAPDERGYAWRQATHVELEHFYAHLGQTLARLRLKPATTMESYVARFRRVLSRVPLESRDLRLLHKLLAKVEEGVGGERIEDRG